MGSSIGIIKTLLAFSVAVARHEIARSVLGLESLKLYFIDANRFDKIAISNYRLIRI